MSLSRRPSRRVPPKGRGSGSSTPPTPTTGTGATGAAGDPGAPKPMAPAGGYAVRPGSRSANRAAKRATNPVQRGPVRGRRNRGYNPAIVAAAIVVVAIAAVALAVGNPFGAGASPSPSTSVGPAPSRALASCPTAVPKALDSTVRKQVTIKTTAGDIVVEVGGLEGPLAAANFLALAECGFYDGVIFHRIVPDFVIQGGDGEFGWTGDLDLSRVGQGGPGYAFDDETVVRDYKRGVLAMANSGPDTNGSQFFITVADVDLPKDYTIFGTVLTGMDIVDEIVNAPRDETTDQPDTPVVMEDFTIVDAPSPAPTAAPTTAPSAVPSAAPTAAPSAT